MPSGPTVVIPEGAGIPVARVSFLDGRVDRGDPQGRWEHASEGSRLRTGDRLRTAAGAIARIQFPWMSLVIAPSSTLSITPSQILSTRLDAGRVEQSAPAGELIKLRTAEAEIRGGGRVVVRREEGRTLVMALEGRFRVEAAGRIVLLLQGQGSIIAPKQPPSDPIDLAGPPAGLRPGSDPLYVRPMEPTTLSWSGAGVRHHLQVREISSDSVVLERDVGGSPATLALPWLGTFRWRVAVRDEKGLEGRPSSDGIVCVVEK